MSVYKGKGWTEAGEEHNRAARMGMLVFAPVPSTDYDPARKSDLGLCRLDWRRTSLRQWQGHARHWPNCGYAEECEARMDRETFAVTLREAITSSLQEFRAEHPGEIPY